MSKRLFLLVAMVFWIGSGALAQTPPLIDLDPDDSGEEQPDYSATFTEGQGPVYITDRDATLISENTHFHELKAVITNVKSRDRLSAQTGQTAISADYANGTLTLSGYDTLANYQAVLRAIQYNNSSDAPHPEMRIIEFSADDGTQSQQIATSRIAIIPVNDRPQIDLDPDNSSGQRPHYETLFPANSDPVYLTGGDARLTDADDSLLAQITVTLINPRTGDELTADTEGTDISADWESGILSLTGTASVQAYQQVLRSVRLAGYSDTSQSRIISFVADDGINKSNIGLCTVAAQASEQPRVVATRFNEDEGPVSLTGGAKAGLSDPDGDTLESLTVTLSNFRADDTLAADTSGTEIQKNYANGVLSLTGTAHLESYERVLETITFDNPSQNPAQGQRVAEFGVSDGQGQSQAFTCLVLVVGQNDPPENTVPGQQNIGGASPWILSGEQAIRISDPDLAEADLEVSIEAEDGTLALSDPGQSEVSGEGTGQMTVRGTLSEVHAALDGLRYYPPSGWDGSDSLSVTSNDLGHTGMPGPQSDESTIAISGTPGTTAHAPVLDNSGDMSLTPVDAGTAEPNGNTVAQIIASAGGDRITDPDPNALEGIAVIDVDNRHGTWQYATVSRSNWTDFGQVSNSNAVVLAEDDWVRFLPHENWGGQARIGFRAWDQSDGRSSGTAGVDTSVNGGDTAFSIATETATITVNPGSQNLPPTADAGADQTVAPGDTVILNGEQSSDPEGANLSYQWTRISGDIPINLSSEQAALAQFVAPDPGDAAVTVEFELTVSDGQSQDSDTVAITLSPGPVPLVAEAGPDQSVFEGQTVGLDGTGSTGPISEYAWDQTGGPQVTLSAPKAAQIAFTAPQTDGDALVLTFALTVSGDSGTDTDSLQITVRDSVRELVTVSGKTLGVEPVFGELTGLLAMDPATVPDSSAKPTEMEYGLVQMEFEVAPGATAAVRLYLEAAAPETARWYLYHPDQGWSEYGAEVFQNNRTQVYLQITDGGPSDADGIADGIITVTSGLGTPATPPQDTVLMFEALSGDPMEVRLSHHATEVNLDAKDPATLGETENPPEDLPYGLMEMALAVSPGDSVRITITLPEPAPAGYNWWTYHADTGWQYYNPSDIFNSDRNQVTLVFADGGAGDGDGRINGAIDNISGLGLEKTPSGGEDTARGDDGDEGDSCFVDSLLLYD